MKIREIKTLINKIIREGDPDTDPEWRNWMQSVGLPLPSPLNMPEPEDEPEERGSTNMPHGIGFPNKSRKPQDIFRIWYIADVEVDPNHLNVDVGDWVAKKFPQFYKKWEKTVSETGAWNGVSNSLLHWHRDELSPEEQQIVQAIQRAEDILGRRKYYQGDSMNPRNYPLFVTAYDLTRQFGGEEEGGWYYDHYDPVKSLQVKNPTEARKAAAMLYKSAKNADLDGQLVIYIEKKQGSQEQDRPNYS